MLVLQAWQLLRGGGAERRLRERLADDLGDLMEQRLAARHRELLIDLHDGLSRQTDRIGEHARADRELLQRGLTAASLQLSRGMQALTKSVDGRLDTSWADPAGVVTARRFFARAEMTGIRYKPDSLPDAAWDGSLLYDPLEAIIR